MTPSSLLTLLIELSIADFWLSLPVIGSQIAAEENLHSVIPGPDRRVVRARVGRIPKMQRF